ncbi:MAG: dTDP-4-dehydrorhamnose 3,5-epimerase [Candidatus Nanohaloarchaea archaeon]
MPFEFEDSELKDVKIIKPQVFDDERGFFLETYVKDEFEENGLNTEFIQDNHSKSEHGVLRGLHYQKGEKAQGKLVRCTQGVIMDVIVDLRKDSETFGEHLKIILSEHNKKMLWVPRGFAHGFYTLSDTAEVQYKVDNDYAPEKEAGIAWNDPELDIDWPTEDPKLSDKDKEWPTLEKAKEKGLLF